MNNYSLLEGERSVFGQEVKSRKKSAAAVAALALLQRPNQAGKSAGPGQGLARGGSSGGHAGSGRQVAGRDYEHQEHCQLCWDGGDLVCCDGCPFSYHPECLGYASAEELGTGFGSAWYCPAHECDVCKRKANAVGGLLFRCEMCPKAYCEDHRPADAEVLGECPRMQALGQHHPKQACFIFCGKDCAGHSDERFGSADGDGGPGGEGGATTRKRRSMCGLI